MKERSAGISISENAIRIAIIEQDGGLITIDKIEEIPYEDFDSLKTNKEVIGSVKKVFSSEHVGSRVIVSIPGDRVIVRSKVLPPLKDAKVLKLIQTEIKDYAIFSGENVILGFVTSKKDADSSLIVWGATKESNIINISSFLRNCRIKAKSIVPSNFALAKAVSVLIKEENAFCIVNIDRDTTGLTFVDNGKVVFTYTQDIGFRAFEENDLASRSTWIGNILTTFTYASKTLNIPVKEVFLSTGTNKTGEILQTLTEKIPYPIVALNVPEDVKLKDEEDYLKIQSSGGNEFICSIGLAALAFSKADDPLFLSINEHLLRERYSDRLKTVTIALVLVAINAAAAVAYPIINKTLTDTQVNLKNVEKSIGEISAPSEDADKFFKDLQIAKDLLAKFSDTRKMLDNHVKLSKVLQEMSTKRPTGLSFLDVTIAEDGKISVRGSAPTIATVLDFEKNLTSATYVEKASIGTITRGDTSGVFTFDVQIFLKGIAK
jgi:hypothetical protein